MVVYTVIVMTKPRLLILSFDQINVDPRVMKQVRRFAGEYAVTTCGPGPQPHPEVEHIELEADFVQTRGRIGQLLDDLARRYEHFEWNYRHIPMVVRTAQKLSGRTFDFAIANDAITVAAASDVVGPERVLADLHEFFPGLPQPDSSLGRRQTRWWEWMVKKYCSKVGAATTVGPLIAERYKDYGVHAGVVANASPRKDLPVRPTGAPIRLVHSGNPFRDRGLGEIMNAVSKTDADVTLDLYLMKQHASEFAEILALAEGLGPRIRINDPVAQQELVETLHSYDVGIHVLPPNSINNELALPNKFFDFVQARLGIIVGPSPEMARSVNEYGLGWVTDSFDERAIIDVLNGLTPEQVDTHKQASDRISAALSADTQVEVWADKLNELLKQNGRLRNESGAK